MMPKARAKPKRSVVMRARVPAAKAKRLRQLAKSQGKTESELLREALDLLDRRERRREAIEGLISMIPERIPTKEEYAFRLGKY